MKQVTIHNLGESTQQEVFDFIAHHMLTQGKKAQSAGGGCRYRIKIDKNIIHKCAAGCLIPDEVYKETMEGKSWYAVVNTLKMASNAHYSLISRMQSIHDYQQVKHWKQRLFEEASSRSLSTEILDQFKND